MPTPPPRKRFQIHLSTAIVMMFVAGGLIWANVGGPHTVANGALFTWGWPLVTYEEYTPDFGDRLTSAALNLLPCLAFLFAVYFLCEYLIRRRAAQKGA